MTVDVRSVSPGQGGNQLIALMVYLIPAMTTGDASESELLVELLRSPAQIFGSIDSPGVPDACCRRAEWEELHRPLRVLWEGGLSLRHLQHLLLWRRTSRIDTVLRRSGSAVLTLCEGDGMISFRYDLPMAVSDREASGWTDKLWRELESIDLMKSNFLLEFTGNGDLAPLRDQSRLLRCLPSLSSVGVGSARSWVECGACWRHSPGPHQSTEQPGAGMRTGARREVASLWRSTACTATTSGRCGLRDRRGSEPGGSAQAIGRRRAASCEMR
ncbi:hypothetical protein Ddc_22173 [Ditylenchus destructor]|nr:hypothetical protein Ddc_22173 [Ditylenchus destructor]